MDNTYDPSSPLVYIHLFKTAGSSVNEIFKNWFSPNFFKHKDGSTVLKELTCTDEKIELLKTKGINNPCFFGHFNSTKNYVWPTACHQFITMLRDPLEVQASAFFYSKQKNFHIHANNVEEYVLTSDYHYGITATFTKEKITKANYKHILKKYFLCIGSLKNYKKSVENFADKLGCRIIPEMFDIKRNVSKNVDGYYIPNHLRNLHEELHPLEYEIYEFVNNYYEY